MSADFDSPGRRDDFEPRPPQLPRPSRGGASAFTPRLVLGLGIVAFGVMMLLRNLGFLEGENLFQYFIPCMLLAVGATQLAAKSPWGWLWLLAGGWTLLSALDVIDVNFWRVFFPVALVAVGVGLLRRGALGTGAQGGSGRLWTGATDRESVSRAFAFMSGNERRNDSQTFRGGDLFAFMGGVTLDLRHAAAIPEGAVLDVFAMWGGIEIRVPENWRVISEVVPLLGGFEDNTKPPAYDADEASVEKPGGRLYLRGVVVMGGVEVKN